MTNSREEELTPASVTSPPAASASPRPLIEETAWKAAASTQSSESSESTGFGEACRSSEASEASEAGARLVIHVGPYKTATTALQRVLSHSAPRLRAAGYEYDPVVSRSMNLLAVEDDSWMAHHQLAFPFIDSPRAVVTADEARQWWRREVDDVVLVSSEALWSMAPDVLAELIVSAPVEARVVLTFRCAVAMARSAWHTAVAEGFQGDLQLYVEAVVLSGGRNDFDYVPHLTALASVAEVTVLDFHAPDEFLPRMLEGLGVSRELFPSQDLTTREHVRPSPWVTGMLLHVHRQPALEGFDHAARAAVSEAVRRSLGLVSPTDDMSAFAERAAALTDSTEIALRELCARNRRAVAPYARSALSECC